VIILIAECIEGFTFLKTVGFLNQHSKDLFDLQFIDHSVVYFHLLMRYHEKVICPDSLYFNCLKF